MCSMNWLAGGLEILEQEYEVPSGAVDEFLKAVANMSISRNRGRSPLCSAHDPLDVVPRTKLIGAYATQGCGVSKGVAQYPEVVLAGARMSRTRELHGHDPEFASFMVNVLGPGESLAVHRDVRNAEGTLNWVCACGTYKGDRIWVYDTCGEHPPPEGVRIPDGSGVNRDELRGRFLDPHHRWVAFPVQRWHCIEPVTEGSRVSIAIFRGKGMERLSEDNWIQLREAGFPCKSMSQSNTMGDLSAARTSVHGRGRDRGGPGCTRSWTTCR
eukprot:6489422-Amphidinium_carterae.2